MRVFYAYLVFFICGIMELRAQNCPQVPPTEIYAGICPGETYTYNGQVLDTPGDYTFTFTGSNGCDSTVLLYLVDFHFNLQQQTICFGDSVFFNNEWRKEEGAYFDTIVYGLGCDSFNILLLSVLQFNSTDTVWVCYGDSVFFNGQWYSNGEVYSTTYTSGSGCDSAVIYYVQEYPPISVTSTTVTICNGDSVLFGGNWYYTQGNYQFTFTNPNGCDSTVSLNIFVVSEYSATQEATICQGDSFYWRGVFYKVQGTYTDTVDLAGACDSVVTLVLIVNNTYFSSSTVSICEGDVVFFAGQPVSTPGFYSHTYTSSQGCDSTITMQLNVNPYYELFIYDTICKGQFYPFYGNNYSTSGVYTKTFTSVTGCDSIEALFLTVLDTNLLVTSASACSNVGYFFYGNTLSSSGTYNQVFQNIAGCDSTVRLQLTIYPVFIQYDTVSICQGATYNFFGQALNLPGNYTQTFTSSAGCDSTYHLHLKLITPDTTTIAAAICSGGQYNFHGSLLTTAGTYAHTLVSSNGCDSVVLLQLTIHPTANTNLQIAICSGQSYNFHGTLLTTQGVYTHTYTSSNGCDSVITLQLTVTDTIVVNKQATICFGGQYNFYGTLLTASGSYTHIITAGFGCDTMVNLQLTALPPIETDVYAEICSGSAYNFNGNTLTQPGTYPFSYTAVNGCDSLVRIHLLVNPTYQINTSLTICSGQSINFFGNVLTTSGTYTHLGTTAKGCDSTVVLQLNVADTLFTIMQQKICYGSFYNFYGQWLNTSGTYYHHTLTADGCNLVTALQLTVDTLIQTNIYATICSNTSYNFFGTTLNTPGTYGYALVSSNGCDSIVRLNLSVNNASQPTNLNAQICSGSSYIFAGNALTQSGNYSHTYTNVSGCDSVVNLLLTVNDSVITNQQAQICLGDTFNFYGTPLVTSGIYKKYLTTSAGCDSIIRLNLGILPASLTTVSQSICAGSSYNFYGTILTLPGVYQHQIPVGGQCDSVIQLTLSVNNTTLTNTSASICQYKTYNFYGTPLTTAGNYSHTLTASNGCDSIINLTLVVNAVYQQTVDTSIISGSTYHLPGGGTAAASGTYTDTLTTIAGCDSIIITKLSVINGISDAATLYGLRIYPHPANERLYVSISTDTETPVRMSITDLEGRELYTIYRGALKAGDNNFTVPVAQFATGAYLLRINERAMRVVVVH